MRVDPHDGRCRSCAGTLEITDADDATMTVECSDCGDSYLVETDAFGDGAIDYYVRFMAQRFAHEEDEA
jgi:transcription elongation factor Elf1